MRFVANGPSIPDELLLARDQGRVIFFCGAGVSRARAGLPDFFGLASSVVDKLGVIESSPAFKLIKEAQEIDQRVGVSGVISADRVFGLLEREFSSHDIEEAVAAALRPPPDCDLSSHHCLIDLATTPTGAVQLVTTNFDRLFDDCGRATRSWQPPRLPDPLRPKDLDGVIYLHGRCASDYSGAEGDGFILSSSEFGRAYLSDGWATRFIREILDRYVIVFVGYTADDPPVQYLLEALRRATGKLDDAYAFQSGKQDDAAARWRHKGVQAIPYDPDNDHAALWLSLEAWAERARAPEKWLTKIVKLARRGPRALAPHERGQIAHLVSTYEGAKRFCNGEAPPPAEWLCVFDPYRRYAKPDLRPSSLRRSPQVDPFDLYGLDTDVAPARISPGDYYGKRDVPADAWDAFRHTQLDRAALRDDHLTSLRGHWANHSPRLIPRVAQLGVWIAKVCDQPAAVWWAAHQLSLHNDVQESIIWELERNERTIRPQIAHAWRALFEAWSSPRDDHNMNWFALSARIKKEGWNSAIVRQLGIVLRPRLSAEPTLGGEPRPPGARFVSNDLSRIMRLDVKYPDPHDDLIVPSKWCTAAVRTLRQNLELALALESEIGGYGLHAISPIVPDDRNEGDEFDRSRGLSGAVLRFARLFSQLLALDGRAARQEFLSWPTEDDTIFARLRIWASAQAEIVPTKDYAEFVEHLSEAAFWGSRHQRDLLLAIAHRWPHLSAASRERIERRLLKGRKRWKGEKVEEYQKRRAWGILARVGWLVQAGWALSPKSEILVRSLEAAVPDWNPDYGSKAAASLEGRSGWVKTDTSHAILEDTPLPELINRAKALSGRSDDHFVENDPFSGLASSRPVRALAALSYAAKRGTFEEWAWRKFLEVPTRKEDPPRLSGLVGRRLLNLSDAWLASVLRPVSDWLQNATEGMGESCIPLTEGLTRALTAILISEPDRGQSGIVRGSGDPDWTTEAINAPVGKIAQSLLHDPRVKSFRPGQPFPPEWLALIDALLQLPGDLRCHALVILAHHLGWLHSIDTTWTETRLLPLFNEHKTADHDAAWSGFLWGSGAASRELYSRLKPHLLALAFSPLSSRRSYGEIIAGRILAGWGTVDETTGNQCVFDTEMRNVLLTADDTFRSQVLWQAQQWASEQNPDAHERWGGQLTHLLRIWPRQMAARSPGTSARLLELAFSDSVQFPELADLILPLLTTIERDHLILPEFRRSGDRIVSRYPRQVLALLYAALPQNASAWPYGIEAAIAGIGEADSSLNMDSKLIELRRRWDAR